LWVNTGVVGFERNAKGQPDVALELSVLDEKGAPTLTKPFVGEFKDNVPSGARFLPAQFLIPLNRPGTFTVQLKVNDGTAKKTSTLSFPLLVE
jgi:hypothetical protein